MQGMGNPEKFDPARLRAAPKAAKPATAPEPQAPVHRSRFQRVRKPEFMPEVPWQLFRTLVQLPGKAGWVGMAIYRLTVMRKKTTVTVNCQQLGAQLGVNPKAVYNALTVLQGAGVITAERGRGSFAVVTLLVEPET